MADGTSPKRSLLARLWGVIMFLLVVGALAASAYLYQRLRREESARAALAAEVFQEVDLGAAGWQPIQGGFYVIDLSLASAGKGTRITGKIVNPTSVLHETALFSVRIDEHRASFTLPRLPPGVAQTFEVTVPDVAISEAKKAFVALDSSTISFASSTTRKRGAGEPPDTDKLLK
jgi:hypothetical protein